MGNKASSIIRVVNIPENPERPPENLENPYRPNFDTSINTNMSIAFSGCLPKRLEMGDEICLQGIIAQEASEFTIALVCIDNCNSEFQNIAYYHKINFEDNSSAINHKMDGNWQQEALTDPFDINQGEPFSVQLIIRDDCILVYCNDQFVTKHFVPLQFSLQSTHIQIWNGLERVESMTVKFAEQD